MAALHAALVLFLYFTLSSGYLRDDDSDIIWPTEYHFKGEKLDFMVPLKQSFEIWYSADLNRSRTQRMWYYGDTGYYYKRYPITNKMVTNKETCFAYATDSEQQDFLPDTSRLTYTGKSTTLFDKAVDIWTRTDLFTNNMALEITLYAFRTDAGVDLPVQEVRKRINYNKGEVNGHEITNYYDYRDTVTEEELTVDNLDECEEKQHGNDFHKDIIHFHPDLPSHVDYAFELFINHHNKLYQDQEYQMRKMIFEKNWKMIEDHNRKNLGYRLELNTFSDKTPEELKHLTGTRISKHEYHDTLPFPHTVEEIDDLVQELPENLDLRIEGDDAPVKNQGRCGSCWAFCTTAAIEGALARVNGQRLLDLSEQSLVDCSWGYNNDGCNGGTQNGALKYVLDHGIPTNMEYGIYKGINSYCNIQNMWTTYNIRGFSQVTPGNPNALEINTLQGAKQPNHCVTVVGYGVRDGEDYWLIKNSYGDTWGEDGYILMSTKNNNCLVLDSPYYPVV